ncbi:type IV pilus modification PilV family protein [Clostridium thermarum]|uniref:type IV pilus modification PilV family protein n=1 Tax=Clostridium thermarum TaxID=1716543 RepID=UPI0013D21409|nr:prepilin-type N-terminal cleavage/methylation domain-containing protein [Clostridium thermarum]
MRIKKKNGFTFLELMVAIGVFAVISVLVIRLNITANKNMSLQMERQNMMMQAQMLLEKYKTTKENIGNYAGEGNPSTNFQKVNNYYVIVQGNIIDPEGGILHEVTVRVRRNPSEPGDEVMIKSHVLAN